jgi:hypothetical protein
VCGFVGVLTVLFGFLLLIWSLLCIMPMFLEAPQRFFIKKKYITYQKKKIILMS